VVNFFTVIWHQSGTLLEYHLHFIVIAAQRLTSHATKFVLNLTDNILSYSSVVYHLKQSYPGEIRTIKCKKPEDFLTLAIFDSSFE